MGERNIPVTGGCLCGAIRYESAEPPIWVGYCHCRMCQRGYGAPFVLFAVFPAGSLRFTRGQTRYYRSSPHARRGFCAECGSPVDYRYEGDSDTGVMIGTLDHPEDWPPDHGHNGIESKVPWHVIADDLPQWPTSESRILQAAKAHVGDPPDSGK